MQVNYKALGMTLDKFSEKTCSPPDDRFWGGKKRYITEILPVRL